MPRPRTDTPAPSTLRVRLFRARTALNLTFEELLYKINTEEQLFTLSEQIEQLLIEAEASNN